MSSYNLEVRAAAATHPKPAVEQPCEAGLLSDEGEEVAHTEGVKGAAPKFLGRPQLRLRLRLRLLRLLWYRLRQRLQLSRLRLRQRLGFDFH